MATCLISLGSNLGDRAAALDRALELVARHSQIASVSASRRHNTAAVGGPSGQGDFVNAAARLETTLSPRQLMALLLRTERRLGRRPGPRWSARAIDLDLLLYDDLASDTPSLILPHPRMAFRRFVLAPAAEVAPDMIHPATGWSVRRLLRHLDTAVDYAAITGPPGAGKTALARGVAEMAPARLITGAIRRPSFAEVGDDSTGQVWATEIEFLDRRVRQLRELPAVRAAASLPLVSDFWLGQSLVFAQLLLADEQFERFEEIWLQARRGVTPPKLLVLLDSPAESLAKRIAQQERTEETDDLLERLERVRIGLRRRITQKHQGPVLQLDATQPDWALAEVLAAAQAMQ